MSGGDLLQEAIAELYSCDPGEFIERRSGLAARARAAGDAALAKKIAGLRKPTRSAWILNQLVRSAPDVTSQLAMLGDELRAAQRSLDGAAIRELSQRRRQLIDALTRQAFTLSGQQSPAPMLKDEVTATLNAALADPQFNEQLQAGALDRAARRDGFGPAAAPDLALLPSPSGSATATAPAVTGTAPPAARAPRETERAAPRVNAEQERQRQAIVAAEKEHRRVIATAEQEHHRAIAAAEQEHHRAIAAAEQAVAEADQAAGAAVRAERADDSAVRLIEEQLAEARRRLADARLRTRRASARQRQARQALDQLQQHPPRASGNQARR